MSGFTKPKDIELQILATKLTKLLHDPKTDYSNKLRALSLFMNSYSNTDNTLDDLIKFLDDKTFVLYTKFQNTY